MSVTLGREVWAQSLSGGPLAGKAELLMSMQALQQGNDTAITVYAVGMHLLEPVSTGPSTQREGAPHLIWKGNQKQRRNPVSIRGRMAAKRGSHCPLQKA